MTSLDLLLRDPGFTPGRKHLDLLLDLLASSHEDLALRAERALLRGPPVASRVLARLPLARPPARARLVRLLGRLAALPGTDAHALLPSLIALLEDPDLPSSRQAALALGRLPGVGVEDALLARFRAGTPLPLLRALTEALGKVGGPPALAFLSQQQSDDPELTRLLNRARVMLTRSGCPEASFFNLRVPTPGLVPVVLRCKRGLETILLREVRPILMHPKVVGPGQLRGDFSGPLIRLASLRVALSFGFPLPPSPCAPGQEATALLSALQGDLARALLSCWGERPARFRVAWRDGGHRRSRVWEVARLALQSGGDLLNTPMHPSWELLAWEHDGFLWTELIPRALPEVRFAYREEDIPAASHPTVAAALALVGGVREDDVIWDPFTGSGLELCERALLGPYAEIHGSDINPMALNVARRNLENARVTPTSLALADARSHRISGLSLALSNPPLGHRVARREHLVPLLESVVISLASQLVPGGRLVWLSPTGDRTAAAGERSGLHVERHGRVDLGGIEAELQVFHRKSPP
ncbi:MAG: hypothetical protein RMJ98_10185 [Myxococcales bacterium]|nr:methyltransferase [Polyangiaceae bacterium]MDW8249656.1 hypothetical protein [Myxococcales bacterium]